LLQHGLPQAQIELVILYAKNHGLACGFEFGGGYVFGRSHIETIQFA